MWKSRVVISILLYFAYFSVDKVQQIHKIGIKTSIVIKYCHFSAQRLRLSDSTLFIILLCRWVTDFWLSTMAMLCFFNIVLNAKIKKIPTLPSSRDLHQSNHLHFHLRDLGIDWILVRRIWRQNFFLGEAPHRSFLILLFPIWELWPVKMNHNIYLFHMPCFFLGMVLKSFKLSCNSIPSLRNCRHLVFLYFFGL